MYTLSDSVIGLSVLQFSKVRALKKNYVTEFYRAVRLDVASSTVRHYLQELKLLERKSISEIADKVPKI